MPNAVEKEGVRLLVERLRQLNIDVQPSPNKTFDLIVDGCPAEVKTKLKPYRNIDFISLTDKQFAQVSKQEFLIYLVCNVGDPKNVEIYKFSSKVLQSAPHKRYSSYEYNKGVLDTLELFEKHKLC